MNSKEFIVHVLTMKTTPLNCRQLIRNIIVRLMSGYVIHYIIYVPTNIFYIYIYIIYNSYNSITIKKEIFPSTVQTFYLYIRRTRPAHCGDYHCKAFNRQSFHFIFFSGRHQLLVFVRFTQKNHFSNSSSAFLHYNNVPDHRMGRTHGKLRNIRSTYYSTQNLCV